MSTFKFNQGTMSNEELEKRSKFWSKEQFRTWGKKELEKDSTKMQKLLIALSKFPLAEIREIRLLRPFGKRKYEMAIYSAHERDFNYAMAIAPKTFFKKAVIDELLEQLESSGNFKCEKGDSLTLEDFESRNRFWSKKQFRTWSKKELERTSTDMQNLLVALKETTAFELKTVLKMASFEIMKYPAKSKEYIIWQANKEDLDYAISIAPKTFKVKQG